MDNYLRIIWVPYLNYEWKDEDCIKKSKDQKYLYSYWKKLNNELGILISEF